LRIHFLATYAFVAVTLAVALAVIVTVGVFKNALEDGQRGPGRSFRLVDVLPRRLLFVNHDCRGVRLSAWPAERCDGGGQRRAQELRHGISGGRPAGREIGREL
jgi:hypothetical protein